MLTFELQAQSSPLAQRVQFLEAKGLTSAEIEDALKQAALSNKYPASLVPAYGPFPYPVAATTIGQQWDWRDYFVCHGVRVSPAIYLPTIADYIHHLW